MTASSPKPPLTAADVAVLLVLLPVASHGGQPADEAAGVLDQLQQRLGAAVRVLKIDAASHPTVVSSFHAAELPACVLVRQGIELWRHSGLPDDGVAALLLEQLAGYTEAQPPAAVPTSS